MYDLWDISPLSSALRIITKKQSLHKRQMFIKESIINLRSGQFSEFSSD